MTWSERVGPASVPGQAEAGDPEMASGVREEVRGLHVAVDHAEAEGVLEGFRRPEPQQRRGAGVLAATA
jgi:hypothetical protein